MPKFFDGDTPGHDRRGIKDRAQVVLTNPAMLHLGILPNHKGWGRLFRNLRYVVLDEAHIYRGIFGSHVANIMRRLRRLCFQYGSNNHPLDKEVAVMLLQGVLGMGKSG